MSQLLILAVAILLALQQQSCFAFILNPTLSTVRRQCNHDSRSFLLKATSSPSSSTTITPQDLSQPEQKVYSLVKALHSSKYDFRIVVIGNGAILETTSPLGPTLNLNVSPATDTPLLTCASSNQSFEFHLKLSEVSKVALTEKEAANKKQMRVVRFLNNEGAPMCSLILRDESEQAVEWYRKLQEEFGHEMQL